VNPSHSGRKPARIPSTKRPAGGGIVENHAVATSFEKGSADIKQFNTEKAYGKKQVFNKKLKS